MKRTKSDLGYGEKVGVEEDVGDVSLEIYCRQVGPWLVFTHIKCNFHYELVLANWDLFKIDLID